MSDRCELKNKTTIVTGSGKGLGKALQEEVREFGIYVHSLNPALIQSQKSDSDDIDQGLIQNQDLGEMVVHLLSQPRRLKIDNIGLWGF